MKLERIKAIGVELEGGWDERPEARMIGDGSIDMSRDTAHYIGELPSPPYGTTRGLFNWMERNYPHHVNSSCGMHVHISFKSDNSYIRAMDKVFFDYIQRELLTWGNVYGVKNKEFFKRLEGGNTYCKPTYNPMGQVSYTDKGPNRYSMLNYCYERYQTIELRVLPAFKEFTTAKAAIEAYLGLVEAWLKQPPRTLKALRKMVILEEADKAVPELDDDFYVEVKHTTQTQPDFDINVLHHISEEELNIDVEHIRKEEECVSSS